MVSTIDKFVIYTTLERKVTNLQNYNPSKRKLNKQKGDLGETIAKKYLISNHYNIIKTKYRTTTGEIDIIAKDGEYIVFIEVKYRTKITFMYPMQAVNFIKQTKIKQVATQFIQQYDMSDNYFRFDVIEVLGNTFNINHIRNAFY